MSKRVSLHLRMESLPTEVVRRAVDLEVSFFQFFLRTQSGKYPYLNSREIKEFLSIRRTHFSEIFVHGSYWINLCATQITGYHSLEKELSLAKRLECTHLVLHPGSVRASKDRIYGIDCLARSLNELLKRENSIKILLENNAHGKWSIGSDLQDFKLLLEKMDHPEKIKFCLDTAHAYVYGYDLVLPGAQDLFLCTVNETIGIENIALIHLNDTNKELGCKIDEHGVIGSGNIGMDALEYLVQRKELVHVPIILELPIISQEQEIGILNLVREWSNKGELK